MARCHECVSTVNSIGLAESLRHTCLVDDQLMPIGIRPLVPSILAGEGEEHGLVVGLTDHQVWIERGKFLIGPVL